MEQENVASKRIGTWLSHKGLNANSASQQLGYANSSKMYKLLQGGSPGFDTMVEFSQAWPELSLDWLVLGVGPMVRAGQGTDSPLALEQLVRSKDVTLVTVDDQGRQNMVLVPIPAQAGYTVAYNEAVYLKNLKNYRVPGFDRGEYRAFEVAGDSMEPTINHRDIVVTSRVDEPRLLEVGEIYVFVTPESVMLKRIKDRVRADDEEIILYSDNPHRKPYGMETRDIMEMWRVRGYVSSYMPSAPDITTERLWEVIEQLGFDRADIRRQLMENAPSDAPL
ncbi:S24 family peptidase [Hymenobacter aerophilus]|uniref:S24 family peptidase n=1 Tax=Hymenobacter aerophilus TaxID=119644 RepID=UPI000378C847|nr:LexA family transcriptional regulator [Hymenobacter aerophilus]